MIDRPRRSALYMPASNAKAIEKARSLACDVVILDLEDAVAPEAKETAREQAVQAIADGGFGRRELVIRINGLDTPWGEADLRAAAAARPDAVLVPKVNGPADVAACSAALEGDTALWAMIETGRAVFAVEPIAAASATSRLTTFVMGVNDLAKETRAHILPRREAFHAALSLSVTAARIHGLTILDGVFNDIEDLNGLEDACRQGVEFGFDGKTLIHPKQIGVCNVLFSPSPAEVDWARAVIAAFALPENQGKGAIRVDGKMTELLHLAQAQRLVAVADAIHAAEAA
ncbi:HpcH/HpaI aldolase/citrate lyase family protein [Caulobacter mirabilis]|uniref:CoA ester lyase n=1 Tax=Caulobacter mirabilis TaxID=69666 RepID=A0A2D2B2J7_9CAUL|nr:CoA ester lyase [Caulobacter mirabilis]ATQ44485.1 CoA ester lyase [Caulobacter mirabilis]